MKRAHPRNLQRSVAEALKQAHLAYQFSPNSHTCSALIACLQAHNALNPSQQTAGNSTSRGSSTRTLERPGEQTPTERCCVPTRPETKSALTRRE